MNILPIAQMAITNNLSGSTLASASNSLTAPSINSLTNSIGTDNSSSSDSNTLFKDIYNNLITNVNQTDATFQADIVKSAEGELDNPHQLLIDGEKANIALQMALSVRNKALEAYDDVIKTQL